MILLNSIINSRKLYGVLIAVLCMGAITAHARDIEIKSPDGKMKVNINLNGQIVYNVSYDDETLLKDCRVGMTLRDQALGENPKLIGKKKLSADEILTPVIPLKFSSIRNHYNGESLKFKGGYSVEFRVYNDAVAYRFVTDKKEEIEVLGEDFSIGLAGDYLTHLQQPGGFKTAYEEPYSHVAASQWKTEDKMSNLPVLMDTGKKYKILISEADLIDYPCLFLKGNGTEERIHGVFPRVPLEFGEDGDRSLKILKEADYIAKTKGNRSFPWRYFFISKEDTELLEQTMTDKLASKCLLDDVSWIKPGQASWEWWNAASPYGPDVNFKAGFNLDTYKYYIDFAAKYGIPYIIMDEGWAMSTRDPYTPNPEVNVHEIIRYGKEKGVGVALWLTWLAVENNFDSFKTFADWGVAGLKIDFMDRSDQWMVDYYERVAKEAAKHHLFVDMHGSFKPAGLEKLYPNLLSYEGVRGMEQMGGCYPDNSLFLPFIRNAVGPMDYTPGAMLSMQPEVYQSRRPNSASIGTRAYQLALFVVFESGIQMLADNPTLYYKNPDCTEFITKVPVVWDETKALVADAGEYVIVAKRKGNQWFIGGITNNKQKEREFEISLDFLNPDKNYQMTYFEDGINAGRQAMDYRKKDCQVKSGDTFKIKMVRNGGWAAIIQ